MKFVTRKSENIPFTIAEETQLGKYNLIMIPAPIPKEFEESILRIDSASLLALFVKSDGDKIVYHQQDKVRVQLDDSSNSISSP